MPAPPEETTSSPAARVVAKAGIVGTGLDEEYVVLDPGPGVYYGLNSVGTAIWEFIQQPRRLADIEAHVCDRFEVTPERCHQDVAALVQQLVAKGLAVYAGGGTDQAADNRER